jgi:putative SOS response-associated peptidase YedK
MCGRYNITDNLAVRKLMTDLGVPFYEQDKLRFSPDVAPGATISIIRSVDGVRRVCDAIWWLMLDTGTLKPNYQYSSFNSRSDKLHVPHSLSYKPYRESRCIIPASAFIEGLGDGKTYHRIELEHRAIAFGGLCREWINKESGESKLSASIVTLPPHPKWQNVHPKSIPLMLPQERAVLDAWLDPALTDVRSFEYLLVPTIRYTQLVTPIGKPSKWNEAGETRSLQAED